MPKASRHSRNLVNLMDVRRDQQPQIDPRADIIETQGDAAADGTAPPELVAMAAEIRQTYKDLQDSQRRNRRNRRRLEDFLQASTDWVWEVDANLIIRFVSDRMTEVIGRPAPTLLGTALLDVCQPLNGPESERLRGAIEEHRPFRDQVIEIRDADGALRRCHLSGVPVFDDDSDAFMGFRGTGTDVSARHKAEEAARVSGENLNEALQELTEKNLELEVALSRVEAAGMAKTQFLANMSHELRTPLNAIIGFADMLKNQVLGKLGNERYLEYAANILQSGEHLNAIISEILDMAKVEAGTLGLDLERTDVAAILESSIELLSETAARDGVSIKLLVPGERPYLWADPRLLKQMALNLLSNGVKFSRGGGEVTATVERAEDGRLALKFSDSGIGVDKDDFEKIFSPFGQVANSMTRNHEGTGLGLPLVKAMIELHDGSVEMESEPGVGTTVTLYFPADRVLGPEIAK